MKRYAPLVAACLLAGLVAFPFLRNVVTGERGMPGAQIGGHFTLQTSAGPLDTASLGTELIMIYFGYTYCPDVCPTELARMAQVYQGLGSDKTRVSGLFVTVDPERDTVAAVTEYARVFEPTFKGLSGDRVKDRAGYASLSGVCSEGGGGSQQLHGRSFITDLPDEQ